MPDTLPTDLLLGAPSDGSALPHVTPALLADAFADQGVLLGGEADAHRIMRWFAPLSKADPRCLDDVPVPTPQLLIVADLSDVSQLAYDFPRSYLLTDAPDENAACALEPYRNRLIVLREELSKTQLLLRVQNLFLRMLIWENELERIVLKGGTVDDLLDASVPIMKNFIFMSDNDFNVIARTSKVMPPDDLHRTIMANGCLTQHTIQEKRFRLPEKTFYTRAASELTPFDRVSYPLHLNHAYFGSISMSCNARPDTPGLRDLFRTLIGYVRTICERMLAQQISLNAPVYFLGKLLRHEPVTSAYIAAQMDASGMPADGFFKVIVFDADPGTIPDIAHAIMRKSGCLHDGNVKCFPFEHEVVAVCYSPGKDGDLSHRKTLETITEHIVEPFGVDCGISSVFADVENLDLGYREARIALGFRGSIKRELAAGGLESAPGAYLFEDALLYCLVDPKPKDERFMRFVFNATIADILAREDRENGTNYLSILWLYLQSERNATVTAQELHMHRNTVLYHIDKIQQRFDFDLGTKTARDWLLVCFKALFSAQSGESLSSILSTDEED